MASIFEMLWPSRRPRADANHSVGTPRPHLADRDHPNFGDLPEDEQRRITTERHLKQRKRGNRGPFQADGAGGWGE